MPKITESLTKQQKEVISLLTKDYKTPKQVAIIRKTSVRAVYKTINKLIKKGLLKRIDTGTYEACEPPTSAGVTLTRPTTNLHALEIKFPILKGKITGKGWKIKNRLNNWVPQHTQIDNLGGLTLRNNNNKSLTVQAHTRDIKDLAEVDNLCFKIKAYIHNYFRKQGVYLDVFNAEVKNLNLATEDTKAKGMLRKGEKITLDLNKGAQKIFNKDNIRAKAWLDGSPFEFSAETNDIEWKKEYLSMPFRIKNLFDYLTKLTNTTELFMTHYTSHIPYIQESKKLMQKLNKQINQKRLKEWF